MKGKMKYVSLMLVAGLITIMLAACSSNNNSSTSNGNSSTEPSQSTGQTAEDPNAAFQEAIKKPYELTMALPIFGAMPPDMQAVEAELNKITQAKINTTVKILPISIGAYGQQMNLMMSSGEKLDLAFAFGAGGFYSSMATTGKVLPIDELIGKYGQGAADVIGADYMKGAMINGKTYGVPINNPFSSKTAIFMRKDLVEKYNIDISSIKSVADLDAVFKTIKEKEPGVSPLAAGLTTPVEYMRNYDRLGDGFGVLPGFDNGLKVVNLYESQEYADLLNLVRGWYKAGYINKDAATTQTTVTDLMKADKAFSYIAMGKPGILAADQRLTGKEMVMAELMPDAYSTTNDLLLGLWTIAQQSENPERAMMLINLMYTDPEVANLLVWGIEGKHYVKVGDNQADYPEGINASNVGYTMQNWVAGNPYAAYASINDDPNIGNLVKEYNASAKKSKALGFVFNTEPVKNEITALNNVMDQYRKVLETGTVDSQDKLPEFIAKLKTAGIEKVIAEKQKQLDAWAASNQ
ncbi:ABC transporter substrate-binding protein [Paenibacillus glycanilyticus]|uniref:ABC transporter substrate-binding protein n=1 Tax=Paenibacillus glycanilyticus TaxID=126569 RepID=UPI000FD94D3D|nr:ABC transporter substrate-binding protein [Paenibacillus glycanilyticus]